MSESMLKSMLRILAGMAALRNENLGKLIRRHVEGYIERNFGARLIEQKLKEFDSYMYESHSKENKKFYLEKVCISVNKEYTASQKFLLLISIFNFYTIAGKAAQNITLPGDDILSHITHWLNIDQIDFLNFKYFFSGQIHHIPQKSNLLLVSNRNPGFAQIKFLEHRSINGSIIFLYIPSANLITFNYNGTTYLEMNGKPIYTRQIYLFPSGLMLSGQGVKPLYFGEVFRAILSIDSTEGVSLQAVDTAYFYEGTDKGVKGITFEAKSGELVGIMGGSGVGKSTLLKLLCGEITPQSGQVYINGHSINTIRQSLKDIMGIMHQEECLVEELTVYENLYFNTILTIDEENEYLVNSIIENKLHDFDLIDCRNNKIGHPSNRQISGGQRKRLAIAMEIVRDPKILLVDEPTSGLSSADSNSVMNILKSTALGGRLVIVNIHQPSSEIFKLFDRIIILDKGGIPIYIGNPLEAMLHFKRISNLVDKDQSACDLCGTIKPEQIFEIIEEPKVDEIGHKTSLRKHSPSDWESLFKNTQTFGGELPQPTLIPKSGQRVTSKLKQFKIFFLRNFIAKKRNKEFVLLALLLPPILAALISIFLRYSIQQTSTGYNLYSNPNLASFFLMFILASLFFGLILSCDDIFKDRLLIKRERFLGLSFTQYSNAKVIMLAMLSLYQTFCFAFIGSFIIELKGFVPQLWLLLFSVSLFGNLTGLIISSLLKSIVAIYILVPFLLIPQILFSGLVVRFDNLNSRLSSEITVPLIGEGMVTRWAVEAAIVQFYISNKYNRELFHFDFDESQLRVRQLHLMPLLQQILNNNLNDPSGISISDREILENGLMFLVEEQHILLPDDVFNFNNEDFFYEVSLFLSNARRILANQYSQLMHKKDGFVESSYATLNSHSKTITAVRDYYHNKSIDDMVRNRYSSTPLIIIDNKIFQKIDPIFQVTESSIGRSHFFAPYKAIGEIYLHTYFYNLLIIWLMLFLLYILLINVYSNVAKYMLYKPRIFKLLN